MEAGAMQTSQQWMWNLDSLRFEQFSELLLAHSGVLCIYLYGIYLNDVDNDDCGQTFIKKDFKTFFHSSLHSHSPTDWIQPSKRKAGMLCEWEKDLLFLKLLTCAHFFKMSEWNSQRSVEWENDGWTVFSALSWNERYFSVSSHNERQRTQHEIVLRSFPLTLWRRLHCGCKWETTKNVFRCGGEGRKLLSLHLFYCIRIMDGLISRFSERVEKEVGEWYNNSWVEREFSMEMTTGGLAVWWKSDCQCLIINSNSPQQYNTTIVNAKG